MNLSYCLVIRFHYEKDDPRFEWRFNHFVNNVLPRIKNQTFKNFDICIRCNPWHKELFESLGLKTFHIDKEVVRYKGKVKKYFHDFVSWEQVIGLDKYDVQMGFDSDDYMEKGYVQKIVDTVNEHVKLYPNQSLHACFLPKMIRLSTGKVEPMRKYTKERGSAFMALFQPNKENYRFIYSESHISIIKRADRAVILPTGYAYAVAHSCNESTGVN